MPEILPPEAPAITTRPESLILRPYEKDPSAIYAASFATVRAEARLERFPPAMQPVMTRLIHSCGMVEIADRLSFSERAAEVGHAALKAGAPVLCDCEMVGAGIIRRYLPAGNEVIVTLNESSVPERAKEIGNTRSAAAVELWKDHLAGAVVAIGNAPTALFHLLELLDQGWPKPAIILGFPVGFIGAAESKAELARDARGCEYIALRGRRGGSAMASAAVNALAAGLPEDA
ncbi:precorrin-8X methylmutase [Yoonia litorea]|uniref:Precorrin-8X methylmutase n=1 Tax=Yoonia litorea TaxID=1123755 RepID=A0A1I6N0I8_9RHOB|nr:precorrin-8X methylmutase [Yoonia litorea]